MLSRCRYFSQGCLFICLTLHSPKGVSVAGGWFRSCISGKHFGHWPVSGRAKLARTCALERWRIWRMEIERKDLVNVRAQPRPACGNMEKRRRAADGPSGWARGVHPSMSVTPVKPRPAMPCKALQCPARPCNASPGGLFVALCPFSSLALRPQHLTAGCNNGPSNCPIPLAYSTSHPLARSTPSLPCFLSPFSLFFLFLFFYSSPLRDSGGQRMPA